MFRLNSEIPKKGYEVLVSAVRQVVWCQIQVLIGRLCICLRDESVPSIGGCLTHLRGIIWRRVVFIVYVRPAPVIAIHLQATTEHIQKSRAIDINYPGGTNNNCGHPQFYFH